MKKGGVADLEEVVSFGDCLIQAIPNSIKKQLFEFLIPESRRHYFFDLCFPSPLIAAAFKDDIPMLKFWRAFGLGGVTLKTVMLNPRTGNPRPRLQAIPEEQGGGLINAMGLPGKGAKQLLHQLKQSQLLSTYFPTGISIGGHSITEYLETFQIFHAYLKETPYLYFYEINISCPNTTDGQDILKQPQLLRDLLTSMRTQTDKVITIKLSPMQSDEDLHTFAKIAQSISKVGLTLGNTQYKSCLDVGLPIHAISCGAGGVSGARLFPKTLSMIRLLCAYKIPIIATGGISTPQQARLVLESGATLIGMATALVENPFSVPLINFDRQ